MSSQGFFDVHAMLNARRIAPAPTPQKPGAAPITVSQLTARIERVIKAGIPETLYVRGEISNYRPNRASGHLYFTLKDSATCINCVMWQSNASRMKFTLKDGMELIATGRVAVYGAQGKYQLVVENLQPVGQGALELAFKQLYAKLEAAGLFAQERKRPIPTYPRRIALVTSRETAALQDMLKVLRRFAWLKLMLFHVSVQGAGAGEQIAAALKLLSSGADRIGGIDVILLARGGGSLEDLWAFNEECVARAIVACRIPIITGIGHEVDTSIADLVADHHAHTPTEAAQVITSRWKNVLDVLDTGGGRLRRATRTIATHARQRLTAIERHEVFRRPLDRVNSLRQLLDDRQRGLLLAMTTHVRDLRREVQDFAQRLERHHPSTVVARLRETLATRERRLTFGVNAGLRRSDITLAKLAAALAARHPRHLLKLNEQKLKTIEVNVSRAIRRAIAGRVSRLNELEKEIELVNPTRVLKRGYSITTLKRTGATVRSAEQVKIGDRLVTRVAEGQVESTADDPKQPRLFE